VDDRLDSEVSECHGISMSQKADVTGGSGQPWMISPIDGSIAACCIEICIDDDMAIENDLHLTPVTADFLLIPFPYRFLESSS
jgi:hypothetical protein